MIQPTTPSPANAGWNARAKAILLRIPYTDIYPSVDSLEFKHRLLPPMALALKETYYIGLEDGALSEVEAYWGGPQGPRYGWRGNWSKDC